MIIFFDFPSTVNSQNEFISLVYLHDELVYDCMTIHREKWIALRHCLPYVITSHSHYSKFIAALKAHSSKTAGIYSVLIRHTHILRPAILLPPPHTLTYHSIPELSYIVPKIALSL